MTDKNTSYLLHLAKLGGDPIPDKSYIYAHHLYKEFVELCCVRDLDAATDNAREDAKGCGHDQQELQANVPN